MTKLYVLLLVVASLLLVAGCASTGPLDKYYSERRDFLDKDYKDSLVKDSDPYVTDSMWSKAYEEGFIVNTCGLSANIPTNSAKDMAACGQKELDLFNKRLGERYFAFDGKEVRGRCESDPSGCKDAKKIEDWVRASHNDVIKKFYVFRLEQLDKWKAQAEAQHSGASLANAGAALTGLSSQLANMNRPQPPSHDRARDCRTVPDGLGGLLTECH